MSEKKLKIAGEVDSYCTKCKLDLSHRIISMTGDKPHQVECLTCRSHHLYRRPKSAPPEPSSKPTRSASAGSSSTGRAKTGSSVSAKALAAAAAENARERTWEKIVSGKAPADFKPYRVTNTFAYNDLIHHSKFGDGYVVQLLDGKKMEVMFKDGVRTLACGLDPT
jgi:hypothetical protein